jgi:hypothetical protein
MPNTDPNRMVVKLYILEGGLYLVNAGLYLTSPLINCLSLDTTVTSFQSSNTTL